jgi:hypothetical protein
VSEAVVLRLESYRKRRVERASVPTPTGIEDAKAHAAKILSRAGTASQHRVLELETRLEALSSFVAREMINLADRLHESHARETAELRAELEQLRKRDPSSSVELVVDAEGWRDLQALIESPPRAPDWLRRRIRRE